MALVVDASNHQCRGLVIFFRPLTCHEWALLTDSIIKSRAHEMQQVLYLVLCALQNWLSHGYYYDDPESDEYTHHLHMFLLVTVPTAFMLLFICYYPDQESVHATAYFNNALPDLSLVIAHITYYVVCTVHSPWTDIGSLYLLLDQSLNP